MASRAVNTANQKFDLVVSTALHRVLRKVFLMAFRIDIVSHRMVVATMVSRVLRIVAAL